MIAKLRIFYKVIILNIDIYETIIVDEKHFYTKEEALQYVSNHKTENQVPIIVQM